MKIRLSELKGLIREALESEVDEALADLELAGEELSAVMSSTAVHRAMHEFDKEERNGVRGPMSRLFTKLRLDDAEWALGQYFNMSAPPEKRPDFVPTVLRAARKMARDPDAAGEIRGLAKTLRQFAKLSASLDAFSAKADKAAEAPADAPLGQIAFATHRKGVPWEADTKEEERLHRVLSDYFLNNVPLGAKDVSLIQGFLADGMYSSVFSPPAGGAVLYRGMGVPISWLKKKAGISEKDIYGKRKGSVEVGMTYSPQKGSSSWTTSKSVAAGFTGGDEATVVLHAYADDNFGVFVAGSGLYGVEPMGKMSNEKEVLGLGPIRVFKITWKA